MVREGRIWISTDGEPTYGSNYTVTAYEVGAQVSGVYTTGAIPVRSGHGFAIGDKFIVVSEFPLTSKMRTVTAVTGTTISCSTVTVAAGDFLINLGPDLETVAGTPNYNASGAVIYSTMNYSTTVNESRVTADTFGRYRYFHTGIDRWELVRTATGAPFALIIDAVSEQLGTVNVKDFGAVGDGVTDDYAAIQAAIDYAESLVSSADFGVTVSGGSTVYIPRGKYKITQPLTVDASGVNLLGEGMYATILWPSAGTDGIRIGDQANLVNRAESGICKLGVSYFTTAAATGTHGIKAWGLYKGVISEVHVIYALGNTTATLTGISLTNCEQLHVSDCLVEEVQGTNSIGYLIDGASVNRGNFMLDNCAVYDAYIGLKVVNSGNTENSIRATAFKVVNKSSLVTVTPLYGIWLTSQCKGMSFQDAHIEGSEAARRFSIGVYLENTVESCAFYNTMLSRVAIGVKCDASSANVHFQNQFWNTVFLATTTVDNAFFVGSNVTDLWLIGAHKQTGLTVTTWLTDNSSASSANLYVWNASGATGAPADIKAWTYKGAVTQNSLALVSGATVGTTLAVTGATTLTGGVTGAMAATGNVSSATNFVRSVQAAVTASTTQTQAGGTALTADVVNVSVCANVNDTVTLPTAVAGMHITIVNSGAQALRIFPFSGDNLGAGVNTQRASALAAAATVRFVALDATNWKEV